ncbi:MAG: helix-turn-helix transcriptional regulator [Actinobacteria bacterium]|nr:helix-turn-helix transcriptional regulator [Actinomycetota bacterium]
MTVSEQIGLNLRKMRRRACMSKDDLSKRTGLHHSEISLLERGHRVPRVDTCIKILESTNADPRFLFEGIAWHEPARWDERAGSRFRGSMSRSTCDRLAPGTRTDDRQ